MAANGKRAGVRAAIGVMATSLLMLGAAAPASAQGIFDRIFGGLRPRAALPWSDAAADSANPEAVLIWRCTRSR